MNSILDPWLNLGSLTLFLAVLFRVTGIFIAAPVFSYKSIPNRVKIVLALSLSFLLFVTVAKQKAPVFHSNFDIVLLAFKEITVGFLIGFVASFIFGAVEAAGDLISNQVGFSMATILDPANEGASAVIATLYSVIASLIFLYLNGHHVILFSLAKSFDVIPPSAPINLMIGKSFPDLIGNLMATAIQMSAPFIVVMTVMSFIFGLLTKLSPTLNIYFNAGFAINPMIGILILMVTLPLFRGLLMQMTDHLTPDLLKLVHDLKGTAI